MMVNDNNSPREDNERGKQPKWFLVVYLVVAVAALGFAAWWVISDRDVPALVKKQSVQEKQPRETERISPEAAVEPDMETFAPEESEYYEYEEVDSIEEEYATEEAKITDNTHRQAPPPPIPLEIPEILEVVDDDIEEEPAATDAQTGATSLAPAAEEAEDENIYEVADENAEFNGNIYAWLQRELRYPEECRGDGVQGRVTVQFVVNKDGSITDVKVLRSPHPAFDKEVKRLMGIMPKWKPARKAGKPVRQRMSLPITFRLNG